GETVANLTSSIRVDPGRMAPGLAGLRVSAFWEPGDPALISLPGPAWLAHLKPSLCCSSKAINSSRHLRTPPHVGRARRARRAGEAIQDQLNSDGIARFLDFFSRGTGSSNPSPPSGESSANQALSGRTDLRNRKFESISLQQRDGMGQAARKWHHRRCSQLMECPDAPAERLEQVPRRPGPR